MKMRSWLWSFNPRNSRTICNSWCATNIFISHLQFTGFFRHIGQIIAPQPTHALSALLQAQW